MKHIVIVTGGLGQIGSFVVELLNEREDVTKIIIVDNYSTNKVTEFNLDKVQIINESLTNFHSINEIFKNNKITAIVHAAAQISVSRSTQDPIYDAEQNIMSTINLVNSSTQFGITRFVGIGSAAAIGNQENFPIPKNARYNPKSYYGLSKMYTENLITMIGMTLNLNYNVVRPFNVYSERMKLNDPYSGVIGILIEKSKNNEPFEIFGDGNQTRDFIHAKDVAKAIIEILFSKHKGEIFHASTGVETKVIELVNIIKKVMNKNIKIVFKPERPGDIKRSVGVPDFQKVSKDLEKEISAIINNS